MSESILKGQPRTEFGKGAARRLRRADLVPAVLYGHGTDPVHVALEGHATMLALKQSNALLSIEVEGTTHLALPKDVQRDPLRGFIEHVDLLLVRRGEKVTVEVRVHVTGDLAPGGLLVQEMNTLSLEVEATHIPDTVEVSVEGAEVGTRVHAGELTLPPGASLVGDPEQLVLNVTEPRSEVAADDAEQAEAGTEATAPEAGAPAEADGEQA